MQAEKWWCNKQQLLLKREKISPGQESLRTCRRSFVYAAPQTMKHAKKERIALIGRQTNGEVLIEKHNEHDASLLCHCVDKGLNGEKIFPFSLFVVIIDSHKAPPNEHCPE